MSTSILPVLTAQMYVNDSILVNFLMKPCVDSLKDAHVLGVYKMVQTCLPDVGEKSISLNFYIKL